MKNRRKRPIYYHIDDIEAKPIFSEDGKFRYILEITKKSPLKNGKTVCVIMQNPSYANDKIADKSVQFMEKLIFQRDCQKFVNVSKIIVVNQFAYIQTKNFKGGHKFIGKNNDKFIESAIKKSDIVVVAWGKSNKYRDRQQKIESIFKSVGNKIKYQTKAHPSRGFYKDFIIPRN